MKTLIATMRMYFSLWFHKRNIIIVSEHKVKHIPVSGGLQAVVLALMVSCICWASYSTGRFIAARSALKVQTQTLRSIASARVESSFENVIPAAPKTAPAVADAEPQTKAPLMPNPVFAMSSFDNIRLYARVAALEKRVSDLQAANESIVRRVRDKTSGRIEDLESIIKQTGLNPLDLKKSADAAGGHKHSHQAAAEGGPYIPADPSSMVNGADELFANLDELAILHQIVNNLPLSKPIKDAEEESPFGRRIDPLNGHLAFHSGLDLAGPYGAKIYSTADGTVISAGRNGTYGNAIDIDHGSGIVTRYGHLSEVLVHEGQVVHKGDVIGLEGSTGRSTGPHLHYEVRYHDQPLNPKNFLDVGRDVYQN